MAHGALLRCASRAHCHPLAGLPQANPPSVAYNDIPWPPSKDVMSGMMQMLGAQGDAAGKTAHRVLTLRWHPDKFLARWGPRVVDADEKAKIMGEGPALGAQVAGLDMRA